MKIGIQALFFIALTFCFGNICIGQLSITAVATPANCPGNGIITAHAKNGTIPYKFRLDSAGVTIRAYQSDSVFNALKPYNNYVVYVQDASLNIANTGAINVANNYIQMTNLSVTQVTYYTGSCAYKRVTAAKSGGKAPYTYALLVGSNVVYGPQSSSVFQPVAAGTYTLQITDGCGEIRTLPGVNVSSVDFKWDVGAKNSDNNFTDHNYSYPPQPYDSTKQLWDRSDPYLINCDTIVFRLVNTLRSSTNSINRRVYIKNLTTNVIERDFSYIPSTYAGNSPTIYIKRNTPYRFYFDDLCNDIDSVDRNYNYNNSDHWSIYGLAGRDSCSKFYMAVNRPNNWNNLNTYSSPVDTITIIGSSLSGDSLVGKKIVFVAIDRTKNADPTTFPRFYGITPNTTYTVRISNRCGSYSISQFVSFPTFSVTVSTGWHMCKENTGSLRFQFRNFPINVNGYFKYSITSGPSSFTDQFGNTFAISYPIVDSVYYTSGVSSILTPRNFPEGTYSIKFTNQCGDTYSTTKTITYNDLLRFDLSLKEEPRCGQNNMRVKVTITQASGPNLNSANNYFVREFWNGTTWVRQDSSTFFSIYYTNFINSTGGVHYYDFTGVPGKYRFTYYSYYNKDAFMLGPIPDNCEYLSRDTIILEGYQNPVILPKSSGFVCTNGSSDGKVIIHGFKGIPNYTFQMLDASNNVLLDNGTDSVFTNLSAGTYKFRIIDQCGNGVVSSISIDTLGNPVVKGNGTFCIGDNSFVTSPPIFEGATYHWTGPNGFSSTNDTIFFSPLTSLDTGKYFLTQQVPGCTSVKKVPFWIVQCQILPIHLISFNVYNKNGLAVLNWVATNDKYGDYYEIQKSADGINWTLIGNQKVRNSGKESYQFIDESVLNGRNYYRLKLIESNGNHSFSQIKLIEISGSKNVLIYPNPTNGSLYIQGVEINDRIEIFDLMHSLIKTVSCKSKELVSIDIQDVPSGVYFVVINSENQIYKPIKVIKQ